LGGKYFSLRRARKKNDVFPRRGISWGAPTHAKSPERGTPKGKDSTHLNIGERNCSGGAWRKFSARKERKEARRMREGSRREVCVVDKQWNVRKERRECYNSVRKCFACYSLLFALCGFSSPPTHPAVLWREWGAGRRALLSSLCRESEKPRWGPPRCGLPCEGFPWVGLPGAGLPVGAFPLGIVPAGPDREGA
jgi:hypothetical protein